MHRRTFIGAAGAAVTAGLAGCLDDGSPTDAEIVGKSLTLATTTSTFDTGLLDEVNLEFEDRFGIVVEAVAQGTGAAIETARNGDADVIMVHARSQEDEFLQDGHGVNRRNLMFNDFVIIGPESDPAGINGMASATEAFTTIAASGSTFVSRGDNSGTHTKELVIWERAGTDPGGGWYREAGAGMGEVLNQATQSGAYTLTDRGTYLSQRSEIDLTIHVQGPIEGGPELLANPYGVIAVNPGVHENVEYDLAMAYIGFLTSPEGQSVIEDYTVEGEQLFFPEAIAAEPQFQQYVPEGWSAE